MVRACMVIPDPITTLGIYGWSVIVMCDRWAASHILSPFVLSLYINSSMWAFNIAGYFEIFEIFSRVALGVFVTFFTRDGASAEPETFVMSYLEDWLIHGGIGALLLGYIARKELKLPQLLRLRDIRDSPREFWLYLLLFGFYQLPYTIFSVDLPDGEFPIGPLIVACWQVLWPLLMMWLEGDYMGTYNRASGIWVSGKWKGRPEWERRRLWILVALVGTPLMAQNIFDWLFSNAIQAWVVVASYLFIYLLYKTK